MAGIPVHGVTWAGKGSTALAFLGLALAVAVLHGLMLAAEPAHADNTFVVNSTGDDGDAAPSGVCNTAPFQVGTEPECTLRAAIEEANATAAPDTINFFIGGSGVKTISPASALPLITQTVTIDGYSEPGASENTKAMGTNAVLSIRLAGSMAGFVPGLRITANHSVVRGLSVTGFHDAGITLLGADNTRIEGNFLGTTPGGTAQGRGNVRGLWLQAGPSIDTADNPSDNNTVGGTSPEARNLISGNGFVGVQMQSASGNDVIGNYIGTTRTGTGDLGNAGGGVLVWTFGQNNAIGGDGAARNTIAFNGLDGVTVGSVGAAGNSILPNSIFSNDGLGINLLAATGSEDPRDGRTPNDLGDADTGPNNLQNFPVLRSAETAGDTTTIRAKLNSTPSAQFVVRFFSNPATDNEGKKFIGIKTVTTNANGNTGTFAFTPARAVAVGQRITATATSPGGDTSEFSAARAVTG